jgi:hypothetical protein
MISSTAAAAQGGSDATAPLRVLSSRRVFFGHHSVGGNILDGLRDLAAESKVPLRIAEGRDLSALGAEGGILHSAVGQNEQPLSKLRAFEQALDGGLGKQVEVAFFKFCYVDFTPETDVRALFDEYRRTLTALKERHPQVTFVHVTAPLTVTQTGAKGFLKNLLGKGAWGERENVRRHTYNELLRQFYQGSEPVFDLAALEARAQDGSASSFSRDGKRWPRLVAEYSDDGQHLNVRGRKQVAAALASLLAELPRSGGR